MWDSSANQRKQTSLGWSNHGIQEQIITVFEPMYLEILNDDLVGFSNTTVRDMLDHLFLSYGNITAVDIDQNFDNVCKAWDPQQPVETLFKQIQDYVHFAESGGATIGTTQKLSSVYSKIFKSVKFSSDCLRWDEKLASDKTWNNFKIHCAAVYHQHTKNKDKQWELKDMQMLMLPKLKMI
jgi:hypothetical protein